MARSNSQVTTLDDAPDTAADLASVPSPVVLGSNNDDALSGERQILTIFADNGVEGGHDAVCVGLNGYTYQIPRGVACTVPAEVVAIIETAKTTSHHAKEGGGTFTRETHRYAYRAEKLAATA
jgi:hypothetical protein